MISLLEIALADAQESWNTCSLTIAQAQESSRLSKQQLSQETRRMLRLFV